jgi:hypothetical protein
VATIRSGRVRRWLPLVVGLSGVLALGCQSTPIDLADGPAPWRIPRPGPGAESYEDSLTGGEVFAMYCNQCHNARALAERPFVNYQNVAAHMRVRANLTGTEYAKLMEFLRRWHDIPSPTPPVESSPKRLIFGQPIAELRDELAPNAPQAGAGAAPNNAAGQPQPAPPPAPAQPQPAAAQPQPQPQPGQLPAPLPPAAEAR